MTKEVFFMKARATLLAIPLIVGVAFAQDPPKQDPPKQDQTKQDQIKQSASQAGSTAGSTTGAPAAGMSGQPAEMKTMTYRGTLVDLACGSATASSGAGQSDTKTAPQSAAAAGSAAAAAGSANRSSGSECPATANSQTLGLKMDNGQTVRFDLVGNQRAQDELKTNKGWNKNLTANKPLKVKISGVLQGDKLIVSSIH
jgi:hypothetical protein